MDNNTPMKPKKEFKVYTRFNDKVTFIALVVGVAITFFICLGIYSYEFFQTQGFWESGAKCVANQDFKCLLDVRIDQTINKDLLLTTIGANLSFIGVIFGSLAVTLYKSLRLQDK